MTPICTFILLLAAVMMNNFVIRKEGRWVQMCKCQKLVPGKIRLNAVFARKAEINLKSLEEHQKQKDELLLPLEKQAVAGHRVFHV